VVTGSTNGHMHFPFYALGIHYSKADEAYVKPSPQPKTRRRPEPTVPPEGARLLLVVEPLRVTSARVGVFRRAD